MIIKLIFYFNLDSTLCRMFLKRMNKRNKENLKQNAKEKNVGDFTQLSHCRSVKIRKNFEMTFLHLSMVKACIMLTSFPDFIKCELKPFSIVFCVDISYLHRLSHSLFTEVIISTTVISVFV